MEIQEYHKIVKKITSSKSFGKSSTYANLLSYLADCSANKNIPKETTIAADIFGKPDFDPSQNTLVRVYVYNLRKKIETYYKNEGKHEKLILKIPKGSYEIIFENKKERKEAKSNLPSKKILLPLVAVLLLSLVFNIYSIKSNTKSDSIYKSELWQGLNNPNQPLTVVIGDLFLFQEKDTLKEAFKTSRNPRVNSLEEFEAFKTKNNLTDSIVEPADYTFLIFNSALWIKDLTSIFSKTDKDFAIRNMARFNPKSLQDGDFIVLGMIKTFGQFREYAEKSTFKYDAKKDAIIYRKQDTTLVLRPKGDPNEYHTDYGIIMKVPGPNSNDIYMFGGIWDTGASQSLKYFTDKNLLSEIESQMQSTFGHIPQYYEILFEVKGIDRMELNPSILEIKQKSVENLFSN